MSDALTIARFCWPEHPWRAMDGCPESAWWFKANNPKGPIEEDAWSVEDWADVHAAELVLIERGLRAEYSQALTDQLVPHAQHGVTAADYATAPLPARVAAPLPARVAAMVACIKAQEVKP